MVDQAPTTTGESPHPFDMQRRPGQHARARRARVALAHDWLVAMRGGELVLDRIARIVVSEHKPANLYTLFNSGVKLTDAIDAFPRVPSRLNKLPLSGRLRRWMLSMYPSGVESLRQRLARDHDDEPIDLLISTSSCAIKALGAPAGVPHICYCHTPARYLWSQQEEYSRGKGLVAALRRRGLKAKGDALREWDVKTVRTVDTFLANSQHTRSLIQNIYQREARVVHPPVRTEFFTPGKEPRQDFWLAVSALEPYKRIDLAIDAAIIGRHRLMVVGDGSQAKALRRHAKRVTKTVSKAQGATGSVEFLGRVPDQQLRTLYQRARLLVFPQIEDFGIVALEAQACGCPVVARRAGGALETVLEGRTGAFFDDPNPQDILDAAAKCPESAEENCRAHAENFSEQAFDDAIRAEIARALR
ncbi:MAG: glycosyltransferase [Phycisphaerales bacterium JB059]